MMITAAQCRSARTLLSWSVSRLARRASVSQLEIDDFELERCVPGARTLRTMRRVLETAGVIFLPHDDVRVCAVPSEVKTPRSRSSSYRTTAPGTRRNRSISGPGRGPKRGSMPPLRVNRVAG